jgi:hypothetical protein
MVCKICGLIAYDDDQTPPMSLTPGRLSLPSPKEVPMAMLEEAGKEWLRGKPGYIGRLRKIVAKYMPGYTVKGE